MMMTNSQLMTGTALNLCLDRQGESTLFLIKQPIYLFFLNFKAFQSTTKGGFFSESEIRFSNLPISQKIIPKNYPELEI